jgi:mono/diheme cytochrome c family protein
VPPVRLKSEPQALSALVATGGDLGERAATVLARVEWPGKPGAAAAIRALTAEEQRRFDTGQEVYKNVCQACHQPDGRGMDKLAPSLVGSPLALGPAEVPIRILLNGKEGQVGLMPPVGQVFTDEQIASVLTYVRREWGQGADPVDPATVAGVRTATAGRSRPWTDAELTAISGGGRGAR